jgi:hypothetical protein
MRRALAVLLILSASVAGSSRDLASLSLRLKIVSQEHCQFTADAQGVTLHVALTFSNSSTKEIVIQQISGLNLTVVAKSLEDVDSGVYELSYQPERFEPERPRNSKPIVLRPGSSADTTDTVSLSVVRDLPVAAPNVQVSGGHHYLQIGEELITGEASPRTWRSATVRSMPVGLTINYLNEPIPACSRKEIEP